MKVKVIKSKRRKKTISIKIVEGKPVVRAPAKYPNQKIQDFITEREDWIRKNIKKHKQRPKKSYASGEKFLYLGKNLTLKIKEQGKEKVKIAEDRLIITTKNTREDNIKKLLEKFYRDSAKNILKDKVEYFANKLNAEYNKIRIKKVSSIWGSCSSNKNLNFNLKLIMAPENVVNYVVLHEVSHLIHLNHSKKYWSLVEKHNPDYKKHKKWLKENSWKLTY